MSRPLAIEEGCEHAGVSRRASSLKQRLVYAHQAAVRQERSHSRVGRTQKPRSCPTDPDLDINDILHTAANSESDENNSFAADSESLNEGESASTYSFDVAKCNVSVQAKRISNSEP